MIRYAFDNAWQQERERLATIERTYDPGTIRILEGCQIADGWQCLEVGAGGGSIAAWLCERVGNRGRVVATDIDTRFLTTLGCPNLDVLKHDIRVDNFPDQAFDLIHMRLLLDMLPDRDALVRKLVQTLKPNGWLVAEEFDSATSVCDPNVGSDDAGLFARIQAALQMIWTNTGIDSVCGRRLYGMFQRANLVNVQAEGRAFMRQGGTSGSEAWRLSLEHLASSMVATGLVTNGDIERHYSQLSNPNLLYLSPLLMATWGQRAET